MIFNEKYDRRKYIDYIGNKLFNEKFEYELEDIELNDSQKQYKIIKELVILGKIPEIDNLQICEITYDSPNDPRVTLTREIFNYMKRFAQPKLLCILKSNNSPNYRLSLVTASVDLDENNKIKRFNSNPRRFSFFLGPNAKVNTVISLLDKKGVVKDFKDLQDRFSVEIVNKEFYNSIALLFTRLSGGKRKIGKEEQDIKGSLSYPKLINLSIEQRRQKMQEFAVRLIGRVVFCWFLKKKMSNNSVPLIKDEILGSDAIGGYKNYYNDLLEKLFFEVLNTPTENRAKGLSPLFSNVPFLNGGLFDPHKDDFYKSDDRVSIPNEWFTNKDETGLFDILELYNFTIDENTSSEIELSIDPEMLGRIFENLLAEINPETGETARKSSGSFYTPRPIVDTMVFQSLKQYLITKTEISEDKIENILNDWTSDTDINFNLNEAKSIKNSLTALKILDPACGSAAFPMGILHRVMSARKTLDEYIVKNIKKESIEKTSENLYIRSGQKITYNPDDILNIECIYLGNYEFEYSIFESDKLIENGKYKVNDLAPVIKTYINHYNARKKTKTIANLFSQGKLEGQSASFVSLRNTKNIKRIVDEDNKDIIVWEWDDYNTEHKTKKVENHSEDEIDENIFTDELSYDNYLYELKKEIILNTIYGVDIQPVAVEISKLRAFLSLVVDEKVVDEAPNRNIKPLPNLEFKFVAANSLIGLPKLSDKEINLFEDTRPIQQLKELREKYFNSYGMEKEEVKNDFIRTQEAIKRSKSFYQYNNIKDLKIADWNPFSDESAGWFDPEWMFGVKEGFDIVIGNPPYVFTRDVEFSKDFKNYIELEYFSRIIKEKKTKANQSGKINLFAIFIIKGTILSKNDGNIIFIVPNNLLRTTTYDIIRKFILENTYINQIVDLGSGIFNNVTASTVILSMLNKKSNKKTRIISEIDDIENKIYTETEINQEQFKKNASYTFNIYAHEKVLKIIDLIRSNYTKLKELRAENIEGIVAHKELIKQEKDIKYEPLIEGKDIKRFYIKTPSNFLLWDKSKIHRVRPDYIWNSSKKIIIQRISGGNYPLVCAVDENKYKTFASVNNLILKKEYENYYYYIAALLNSKVLNWFYANNYSNNSELTVNISKTFMDELPIPIKDEYFDLISTLSKYISKVEYNSNTYFNILLVIDSIIYELFFYNILKERDCEILENIKSFTINNLLFDNNLENNNIYKDILNPSNAIFGLINKIQNIPEIRILEGLKL